MALLTAQVEAVAGITPTYSTAVSASDTITMNAPYMILEVVNAGGSSDTVTVVDASRSPAGNLGTSQTVSVPATTGRKRIRIPREAADPTTGLVTVTHSFTTSVTCGLFSYSP